VGPLGETTRLSVLITGATSEQVKNLTALENIDATELVRRSIGTYAKLKEFDFIGAEVHVIYPDGTDRQLFLPEDVPSQQESSKNKPSVLQYLGSFFGIKRKR
jgi:hypothetical protein